MSRDLKIAGLLVLLAIGVYSILMPPKLERYENETAAVSEGIARGIGAKVPDDTELILIGAGQTSRTGVLQPVVMIPFYEVGSVMDDITSDGDEYTYRSFVMRFFSALVMALTVGVLFLLVRVLGRSEGWAMAISLLYGFATFALPYAGIGIEPTGVILVMGAYLAAAHAARSGSPWLFGLTGVLIGLSASTRPTTVVPALGALILLWPRVSGAAGAERRKLIGAVALPLVLGALAFILYNLYRFDEPFSTGYSGIRYNPSEFAVPALGLYLSPGYGLVWFCPLAILGFFAMPTLWRENRNLAVALVGGVVLGTLPFLGLFWAGDDWGPRYLVAVAWMPLIALAWWATTRKRRIILGWFAAVTACISLVGTLISYEDYVSGMVRGDLTGTHVFGTDLKLGRDYIPYGDDGARWIPTLSPIHYETRALATVTLGGLGLPNHGSFGYAPFRGRLGTTSLEDSHLDVWWNPHAETNGIPKPTSFWLIPFGALVVGAGLGLFSIGAGFPEQRASRRETGAAVG